MKIPPLAFKIAAQLIQDQLAQQAAAPPNEEQQNDQRTDQLEEPADLPGEHLRGTSALRLFGLDRDRATATEPAPKVVTDSGKQTT